MDENPYKAPVEAVGPAREPKAPKPMVTASGCMLAIVTGLVLGFGMLYLIGLVRSIM